MERKIAIVIETADNGFMVKHPIEWKARDSDGVFIFEKYETLTKWLYDHFCGSAKTDIPV